MLMAIFKTNKPVATVSLFRTGLLKESTLFVYFWFLIASTCYDLQSRTYLIMVPVLQGYLNMIDSTFLSTELQCSIEFI